MAIRQCRINQLFLISLFRCGGTLFISGLSFHRGQMISIYINFYVAGEMSLIMNILEARVERSVLQQKLPRCFKARKDVEATYTRGRQRIP
jgi:hypothetical protein